MRAWGGAGVAVTVILVIAVLAITYAGSASVRTTVTNVVTSTDIVGTETVTHFPVGELYEVTFVEGSACGAYIYPWGVDLANQTVSQPSGVQPGQFPIAGYNSSATFHLNTIVFSLPSGSYFFTVYPNYYLQPASNATGVSDINVSSGLLTVKNSSLTVDVTAVTQCYS